MNVTPKISVVIPLYNKERHIERAIRSVLNQKYPVDEIIIVNDASTDLGRNKAAEIQDAKIKIIDREEPGPGGYAARNLAIEHANGEYIAFLDADDEWEPEHIDVFLNIYSAQDELAFYGSAYNIVDVSGNKKLSKRAREFSTSSFQILSLNDYLHSIVSDSQAIWTSSTIVRKDVIENAGLFPEGKAKRGGDTDTWLRVAWLCRKVFWSSTPTVTYYMDSDNRVTKTSKNFEPFNLIEQTCRDLSAVTNDAVTRRYLLKIKGKKFYELSMARKKYSGKFLYSLPKLKITYFLNYPKCLAVLIPDFVYRFLLSIFKR